MIDSLMRDPEPPHILLVNPVGVIGGAERVLLACARAIKESKPDARVSALLMGDGPLRPALEALGVTVLVVPMPERLASAGDSRLRTSSWWGRARAIVGLGLRLPATKAYVRVLKSAIEGVRPTLIHAHGFKAMFLLARNVPTGVPLVWHVHDFCSERPMVSRLVRLLSNRVTRAIAVSDAVAHDLASVAPALPVTVVRNGVDLSHFSPAPRDGADLDRLAGLASDAGGIVRVGLVATYADWKGHEVFLRSLARQGPTVRGYVVGGPIYATAGSQVTLDGLRELAQSLGLAGRVGFVPFQVDPADVYRMLDVVVHASTRPEPFGLTVAEAMACGRAVVVSAAGGALELFEEGVTAIGHPPGDVDALARAIDRLVREPGLRARLGGHAHAHMQALFGHERFARELLGVHEEVARGRSIS